MDIKHNYADVYSNKTSLQIRQKVESFVRSGDLRSVLEKSGELKDHEIDYLIGLLRIATQGR